MEEVKDLRYEQSKGPEALLDKLASAIPGYQGYREREKRREADKKHRDYIGSRLSSKKSALEDISEELIDNDQIKYVSPVSDVMTEIDGLKNKITGAASGGAGVFFDIEADTEFLDRIYEHDLALLQSVEALDTSISTLSEAVDTEDNIKAAIKGVRKAIKGIDASIETRDKMIRGLE